MRHKLLFLDTFLLPLLGIFSIFGGIMFNYEHFCTIRIPSEKFQKGMEETDSKKI